MVELIRKPIGPIISELLFERFCSLNDTKKIEFFIKKIY